MSFWFQKLQERQCPPGVETTLLRWMPRIVVLGTLAHGVCALLARLWLGPESTKLIGSVDIFLIAALITFWTAVVTVSIGCFIVYVMKGPAYVADAYALNEGERPRRPQSD